MNTAVLLALFSLNLASAQNTSDAIECAKQLPDLTKKSGETKDFCKTGDDSSSKLSYSADTSLEDFMSGSQCSELLSTKPTKKFSNSNKPVDSFLTKHWQPFCSQKEYFDKTQEVMREGIDPTPTVVQERYVRDETAKDDCVLKPQEQRFNKDYVPPTQLDLGLGKGTQEQRDAMVLKVEGPDGIRQRTKEVCCQDKGKLCRELVDKIELRFCDPQHDNNVSDQCTTLGTFYKIDDADYAKIYNFFEINKTAVEGKEKFPLAPGYIQVSNLFNKDGTAYEPEGVLEHEFGHACSSIRRQISTNYGHEDSFKDMQISRIRYDADGKPTEGCKVTSEAAGSYKHLWSLTGAESDTIECYKKTAISGDKTLFKEPPEPCTNGCPRSHIEESYADWFKVALAMKSKSFDILKNVCRFRRSNLHSLGQANLNCALKTDSITSDFKKTVGCKR